MSARGFRVPLEGNRNARAVATVPRRRFAADGFVSSHKPKIRYDVLN